MKKSRLVIGIIAAVILFLLIFGNPFSSPTIAEITFRELIKSYANQITNSVKVLKVHTKQ